MKRKIEKGLRWLVTVTLTIGGLPMQPDAQAQLYPASDTDTQTLKTMSPSTPEAQTQDSNSPVGEEMPGYPMDEGALDPTDESQSESAEADSSAPARESASEPSQTEKIEGMIEAGLEKNWGTDVDVTVPMTDIEEGLTVSKMEEGGVTTSAQDPIYFTYQTLDGRAGEGEAVSVINPDGSLKITGVNLEEKSPAPESSERAKLAVLRQEENGIIHGSAGKGYAYGSVLAYWKALDNPIDGGGRNFDGKMEMPIFNDGEFKGEARPMPAPISYLVQLLSLDGTLLGEIKSPGQAFVKMADTAEAVPSDESTVLVENSETVPEDLKSDGSLDGESAPNDINKDGIVNIKDAAVEFADNNSDGVVDSKDSADTNGDGVIDEKNASTEPQPTAAETVDSVGEDGPSNPYLNNSTDEVLAASKAAFEDDAKNTEAALPENPQDDGQKIEVSSPDTVPEADALPAPESRPFPESSILSYEDAKERAAQGEGTIVDIDPKNPSQSPCEGGQGIESPGASGITAWFCPNSSASTGSGLKSLTAGMTPDPAAVPDTTVSGTNSTDLDDAPIVEPKIESTPVESTPVILNSDGTIWAKQAEIEIKEEPVSAVTAANLEDFKITAPAPIVSEKAIVRVVIEKDPSVAAFQKGIQAFQPKFRLMAPAFSELRQTAASALGDALAILKEKAAHEIAAEKRQAEIKIEAIAAGKQETRASSYAADPSAVRIKNEDIRAAAKRDLREEKDQVKQTLKSRIHEIEASNRLEISNLKQLHAAASTAIEQYSKAYKAGTFFSVFPALGNPILTSNAGEDDSLLG